MSRVAVSGPVAATPGALWSRLADFGDVSWVPGVRVLEVRGQGPGMARVVAMGDGAPATETLERLDTGARTLHYAVTGGERRGDAERARRGEAPPAFPVRGYRASLRVTPAPGGCELHWSCAFEADGVPEPDAVEAMARLGALLYRWLKADLEGG